MHKNEILHARLGEMLDMIDCHAIANGAEPKQTPMSFDDAIALR